jgi:flagellar assembly protein FliH
MAIIKGPRHQPQQPVPPEGEEQGGAQPQGTTGGEENPALNAHEEPFVKRSGLIKGKTSPSSAGFQQARPTQFLSDSSAMPSFSKPAEPQKKRGKILKAGWASSPGIEKKDVFEDIFGDASDFPEAPEPIRFEDHSFMKAEDPGFATHVPQDHSRNIKIPSGAQAGRHDEMAEAGDFRVSQAEQISSVDVEAIIAEAEQKAREKAERIIEHAQGEAKKLLEQAKVYGETARQESQKEGFKLGKEDGYKAGLQEFTGYMEEAKNLFTQLLRERESFFTSVEPELAKLSLAIASKIIGDEIDSNKDTVVAIIKNALSSIKSREQVTIKVNPEDAEYVRQNKDVFAKMVEGAKEFDIASDPRVDKGGCMIETDLGTTDARITVQMSAIEMAFRTLTTGDI